MRGRLKTLGVRVRRVADLEEGAIYLPSQKVLLLDIEMTDKDIDDAIEQILPMASEASA